MSALRSIDDKELVHERLGAAFERAMSPYDTQRRVEVLVDRFLGEGRLRGRSALDVGCGLGHFSRRMLELGADVTACDLGPVLVQNVARKTGCRGVVADALNLAATFAPESFDVVVSSECIEHTPDPRRALGEMARLVKPGGFLAVSTPNLLWSPVVKLATQLKLRPFDGLENFSTWGRIRRALGEDGVEIVAEAGLHLYPFQLGLHGLSRWLDGHAQPLKRLMINICVLGRKRLP
ncbi:MAG: class I SAM-dependent methyltransferase [Alphaproteobacteria bacterium]